jgi:hypothetical protein
LIIGGNKVFLPASLEETSAHIEDTTKGERQPVDIVMKEDVIQILNSDQEDKEDHSAEYLKIFSHKAKQEMTVELDPTT